MSIAEPGLNFEVDIETRGLQGPPGGDGATSILSLDGVPTDGTAIDIDLLRSQLTPYTAYIMPRIDNPYVLPATLLIDVPGVSIDMAIGTVLKLDDAAPATTLSLGGNSFDTLTPVYLAANDTKFFGTIDANKAGQNKNAWNASPTPGFNVRGYCIEAGRFDTALTGVEIDIIGLNAITQAVGAQGLDTPTIVAKAIGAGGIYRGRECSNERLGPFIGEEINCSGFRQGIQLVDIRESKGDTNLYEVFCDDQWGNDDPEDIAVSSFLSAVTAVNCDNLIIGKSFIGVRQLTGMNGGLGYSFVVKRLRADYLRASGFPNMLLEIGTSDFEIGYVELDMGRAVPYLPDASLQYGVGCSIYDNNTYTPRGVFSRANNLPHRGRIGGGIIQNCYSMGLRIAAAERMLIENLHTPGNRIGMQLEDNRLNPFHSFPGRPRIPLRDFHFVNCDFSGNLVDNVRNKDGIDVRYTTCKSFDAGQNSTRTPLPEIGTSAIGLNVMASTHLSPLPKTGLQILGLDTGDTQDWTDGWLSYNPAAPKACSSNVASRVRTGQTLLVGSGMPLKVVRYKLSGTRSGGATTRPLVSLHAPIGLLPAALSGEEWNTSIYIAKISATANVGDLVLKLAGVSSPSGAVVESTDSSAISSATLTQTNLTRTMSNGATVAAAVQLTSNGNITDGSAWEVVFDVSYPLLYETGHAFSSPSNGGAVVGVVGSGGAVPADVTYSGPDGTMTVEIVSVTDHASLLQNMDVSVASVSEVDEFMIEQTIPHLQTVAGTGLLNATGLVLTGAGTDFDGEFTGRIWIGVNLNNVGATDYPNWVWRQVAYATTDIAAGLLSAFPTDFTGKAFRMVKHQLSGKPSQAKGIYIGTTQAAGAVIDPLCRHSGNLSKSVDWVTGATPKTFALIDMV